MLPLTPRECSGIRMFVAVMAAGTILHGLFQHWPRLSRDVDFTTGDRLIKRINLNTADAAQLAAIPWIGPAAAQRIIEFRQQHGPYMRCDELQNVKGIGPLMYERIAPFLTVVSPER